MSVGYPILSTVVVSKFLFRYRACDVPRLAPLADAFGNELTKGYGSLLSVLWQLIDSYDGCIGVDSGFRDLSAGFAPLICPARRSTLGSRLSRKYAWLLKSVSVLVYPFGLTINIPQALPLGTFASSQTPEK